MRAENLSLQSVVTTGFIGRGRPGLPPEGIQLENNVWVLGTSEQALIVDAAHNAEAIAAAVGDRDALGILLTHGHEDHVNAAVELAELLDTHVYLHPADLFLWQETHGDKLPDFELVAGASFNIGEVELVTRHTPGHTPGSVCFVAEALDLVFSGDTLFRGGPGATRWEYSSFPQILDSISTELLSLPAYTSVLPGHGPGTSIEVEASAFPEWQARGW